LSTLQIGPLNLHIITPRQCTRSSTLPVTHNNNNNNNILYLPTAVSIVYRPVSFSCVTVVFMSRGPRPHIYILYIFIIIYIYKHYIGAYTRIIIKCLYEKYARKTEKPLACTACIIIVWHIAHNNIENRLQHIHHYGAVPPRVFGRGERRVPGPASVFDPPFYIRTYIFIQGDSPRMLTPIFCLNNMFIEILTLGIFKYVHLRPYL